MIFNADDRSQTRAYSLSMVLSMAAPITVLGASATAIARDLHDIEVVTRDLHVIEVEPEPAKPSNGTGTRREGAAISEPKSDGTGTRRKGGAISEPKSRPYACLAANVPPYALRFPLVKQSRHAISTAIAPLHSPSLTATIPSTPPSLGRSAMTAIWCLLGSMGRCSTPMCKCRVAEPRRGSG